MDVAAAQEVAPFSSCTLIRQKPHSLSSSSQPFLLSPPTLQQASLRHGLRRQLRLQCSASARYQSSKDGATDVQTELSMLHRRQLLLRSGSAVVGMAGAGVPASLWLPNSALASPVQPPDLKQCTTPIDPGNGAAPVNCCLPVSNTIADFTFPSNQALRTRPSADKVSSAYVAKYKQAYTLLRQLPESDPRTYMQQANVHCAFCDAAYDVNGTQLEYQVHNSWLFFPWHRWYLYFHERILASLIKDDTFALPFWNWDSASGYTVPPLYADTQSSLNDANRNPLHKPPSVVDLNYNFTEANRTPAAQLQVNNAVMYRQVVTGAKTPSLFFGDAYRQGDEPSPGAGTVENIPHGTVHIWTGNPANPNDEDMGTLYSAARDPIFFAHHSNIDRLWVVWKSLGGRRTDLTDPDYLNATFLFYDENAKLVRVRIGDALDPTKLGYKYEDVPNPWVTASTARTSSATAMSFGPGGRPAPAMAGSLREDKYRKFKAGLPEFKDCPSKKLDQKLSALVKRPRKVRADDFDEEVLVLEGVTLACDEQIKFDMYINLLDEDVKKVGCDVPEYAGSFVNVPHMGMKMGEGTRKVRKSNFRIGIGDVLKELDIEDDDDFAITIVPRGSPSAAVVIENVRVEYE